jgi:hypothetical protein
MPRRYADLEVDTGCCRGGRGDSGKVAGADRVGRSGRAGTRLKQLAQAMRRPPAHGGLKQRLRHRVWMLVLELREQAPSCRPRGIQVSRAGGYRS